VLKVSEADADRVIALVPLNKSTQRTALPAKVSVRTALQWYFDLCGPPKKATLRAFAHHCKDPQERENFLKLLRVNPESQEQYRKLQQKVRTTFGFLRKYPSCEVPLAFFMEQMPRVVPRYFSISSDQLLRDKSIVITAAVLADGVCTQMLKNSPVGTQVPVFVRKSNFHLPLRAKNRPLILIGPGTGVAPLIGFLERRTVWKNRKNELGECILFFGCRNKAGDFIYEDTFSEAQSAGVLTSLEVAFSRDQSNKIYVQNKLQDRAADVWRLIEAGGGIYVCGDARHMARDVDTTLEKIVREQGKKSDPAAFLAALQKSDRYLRDVWSSAAS
jgi:NADPH-ferrihemoprotein reductase